jgi:hypothetical protein
MTEKTYIDSLEGESNDKSTERAARRERIVFQESV